MLSPQAHPSKSTHRTTQLNSPERISISWCPCSRGVTHPPENKSPDKICLPCHWSWKVNPNRRSYLTLLHQPTCNCQISQPVMCIQPSITREFLTWKTMTFSPFSPPPLFLFTHHILHSDSTITAHNVVYFYRSDLLGRMYHWTVYLLFRLKSSFYMHCLHILPFILNNILVNLSPVSLWTQTLNNNYSSTGGVSLV